MPLRPNIFLAAVTSVALLGAAHPLDIVFTGGGTGSDNLGVAGPALADGRRGGVVTPAVEHEAVLETAGITVNKNAVPFDPEKPFVTSGIRVGTAALTTRGFAEEQMQAIARIMGDVLESPEDEDVVARAAAGAGAVVRGRCVRVADARCA